MTKEEIKAFCINAYNGCSTGDENDELESYENFLERQLYSRIEHIKKLEKERDQWKERVIKNPNN